MSFESVRIALQGIAANKLRSALTMLGILIGVASVIVLVAVGTGSKAAVAKQFEALGSNTLTVINSGGRGPGGARTGTQSRLIQLTDADVAALQNPANCPDCKAVLPVLNAPNTTGTYNGATYAPGQFLGTTAEYSSVRNAPVEAGSFFTADDVTNRSKVVVIGTTVMKNLFGDQADPSAVIGSSVKFGTSEWTVIGVLKPKGTNGVQDQDDIAVAPVTSVKDKLSGSAGYNSLIVQAVSKASTTAAQSEVTATLNSLHKVTGTSPFSVLNQATLQASQEQSRQTLTVLLGIVAAISLLVGGIGVMNIMLVTVTERTREIGVRKAIGAQKSHILSQFLVEAVMVSVFGGLLGIGAGLVGSQFRIVGTQPVIAPYSIGLAFGVAVLTGLFFGLYPANRAASLRPIDALRYE
jgi:putative ABC transport system permease protein